VRGGRGGEGDIQDLPRVECPPRVQGRLEVPHDPHATLEWEGMGSEGKGWEG
jgi:hypothetical protein